MALKRYACMLAALTALIAPSLKAAVLPLNTWETFGWSDGGTLPFAIPDIWTFTTTQPTVLEVTDGFNIGDEFSVMITGGVTTSFDTSAIKLAQDGVSGPGVSGPTAWADSDYSQGSILLGAGTYTVNLDIIRNAAGATSGDAFIQDAAVPEPGSLALLVVALIALGCAVQRRNRRAQASESR